MRDRRDLRVTVALALVCAVGSVIEPLGAVRIIFAVPLTLILPGYAIAAAAFGPRRPGQMELVPLVLGLSLGCLALAGLLLNYTPGGIRGLPWAVLLFLVISIASLIAARRDDSSPGKATRAALPKPNPVGMLLIIGTLAMAAGALVLAHTTLSAANVEGFTQLWIAPGVGAQTSARIGVTSEQQADTTYRLVVEIEGRPGQIVRDFSLEPSQERVLTVSNPGAESQARFEAKLYLTSRPGEIYRRVFGWLGTDRPGSVATLE